MAVKVKRERPDQRRHHRVTAPLFVTLNGQTLRAADWSLGGLRLEGVAGAVPTPGTELALTISLPFQGFDVSFPAKAEVVRCDPAQAMVALRYTELGERELMSHFIEELVRGSMVDIEDTIQRIDVPVTPASLEPDKPRLGQLPVQRWPRKLLAMTALYAIAGLFIFGYAGVIVFANFFRMEVPTAVIAAPVEVVTAQGDGRVAWASLKPGDPVRAGEIIMDLLDNKLEREIELAEISISEQKARFASLKRRHLEEIERIRGYAIVDMKNIKQTQLELEALNEQLRLAEANDQRLRQLGAKGFTAKPKLEDAQRQVIGLRKDLEIRRLELQARLDLHQQNIGKRMYSGNETIGSADFFGKSGELEADIRLAEHEIQIAQQRHIAFLKHRDRLSVRAPFDGVVLELPHVDKGSVRRGDVVAKIEQRQERHILAFLNQDEVNRTGLGDAVIVYLPALNESLRGRIRQIDRTSGFLREQDQRQAPGYNWRGPTDRSAKVVISFEDPDLVQDAERYRPGLPAVVVFEQRTTSSLWGAIKKSLSLAM